MKINSISFGMRFSPETKKLINSAKNDCVTYKQEAECEKCVRFLERIFPQKTLDIKTEFYEPKGVLKKLFGKKGYYDIAYIDNQLSAFAKIQQAIPEKKVKMRGIIFVGGLAIPYHDTNIAYRKETNLERLIAISNTILINKYSDIAHFPYTPINKFLGNG